MPAEHTARYSPSSFLLGDSTSARAARDHTASKRSRARRVKTLEQIIIMQMARGALLLIIGGVAFASADVVEPKTGLRFNEKGLSRLGVRVNASSKL